MTAHHATPDDGQPSSESRARLAAELHEQLAASRMAWDAALLRSDAALAAGDQVAADAALEDHRQLLGALEERLGAVVAAAVVAREAEDVVRAAAPAPGPDPVQHRPRSAPSEAGRGMPAADVPSTPGRRLASSLLGAAAAVLVLASVLVGDLPLEPRGSIAGSSTEDVDDLRAQIASERVAQPSTGFAAADVDAPRAHLPAFSGSLPPVRTAPATPAPDATPDEPPTTAPREAPRTPTDAPSPETPAVDVPTEAPVSPPEPDTGRIGELLGRLDRGDGEGDVDGDVSTSGPRPLADLAERLREPRTAPPASDPTGGLG